MQESDRKGFAEVLFGIGEIYDTPMTDIRVRMYWDALADLPLEAIRAAAHAHLRTSKFFPRPSELREAIDGSDDDRAEVAWMALLREVRRVGYMGTPTLADPVMRRAAMDLYGSWRALCERLPADGPEFLGAAKLFKASYQAYARREGRETAYALDQSPEDARKTLEAIKLELVKRGLPTQGLD